MNLNILCYALYLLLTLYIIIWVGNLFHRNGRVFIRRLFNNQMETADTTNNILLLAYYLFNIGYAVLALRNWPQLFNWEMLIGSLTKQMGFLILILAVTHYFNMFLIFTLSKNFNYSHKNQVS